MSTKQTQYYYSALSFCIGAAGSVLMLFYALLTR